MQCIDILNSFSQLILLFPAHLNIHLIPITSWFDELVKCSTFAYKFIKSIVNIFASESHPIMLQLENDVWIVFFLNL
jgi:hypothetical protein